MSCGLVACTNNENNIEDANTNAVAEKITLDSATLGSVEFENADTVSINQEGNVYNISGTITALSESEKNAFGDSSVTHAVVLKYTFDKEKTISKFELKGNITKVFSDNTSDENYVGSISDLLDSEENEDAFCYLILSAKTKQYTLTATYTDKTSSVIKLNISATLATATTD